MAIRPAASIPTEAMSDETSENARLLRTAGTDTAMQYACKRVPAEESTDGHWSGEASCSVARITETDVESRDGETQQNSQNFQVESEVLQLSAPEAHAVDIGGVDEGSDDDHSSSASDECNYRVAEDASTHLLRSTIDEETGPASCPHICRCVHVMIAFVTTSVRSPAFCCHFVV